MAVISKGILGPFSGVVGTVILTLRLSSVMYW